MKIAISGTGYVGLALGTMFALKHEVKALDIIPEKVEMINKGISPIKDKDIESFLKTKKLNLEATLDYEYALKDADYIFISTPTNYDVDANHFDTSSVEDIIKKCIKVGSKGIIVIKSTVPVGFVNSMKAKYGIDNIIFSPEFCREGKSLYDSLYPTRIIIGEKSKRAIKVGELLKEGTKNNPEIIYMNPTEAEAVKLFANTYLAMRVAYFNELDTYAELKGLDTASILAGLCSDPRIGNDYNNPSFGYGGYCLPKDTKQLRANYAGVPEKLISAIVESNETRKEHIANMIIKKGVHTVGVYRLIMKSGSDNFRSSAIHDIIAKLKEAGLEVIIYEPTLSEGIFDGCKVVESLEEFDNAVDVVITNRYEDKLDELSSEIYTRDVFRRD